MEMESRLTNFLLNHVFCAKYQVQHICNRLPGFSDSESDTGKDVSSILSDTLGISNQKNSYTSFIKNM